LGGVVVSRIPPPSPIEAEVCVIFPLAEGRVAVGEEELKAGIAEIVGAADIHEGGGARLGGCQALAAVGEDFRAQGQFFTEVFFLLAPP